MNVIKVSKEIYSNDQARDIFNAASSMPKEDYDFNYKDYKEFEGEVYVSYSDEYPNVEFLQGEFVNDQLPQKKSPESKEVFNARQILGNIDE